MRKFFKSIVQIEIISDEPIGSPSLDIIHYEIMEGDWSGQYHVISETELTPSEAANELIEQGSDPGFFGLDDLGNEVEI